MKMKQSKLHASRTLEGRCEANFVLFLSHLSCSSGLIVHNPYSVQLIEKTVTLDDMTNTAKQPHRKDIYSFFYLFYTGL